MKITEYIVEVYQADNFIETEVVFSSETPFMEIKVGDVLNPRAWRRSGTSSTVLRVIGLEHIIEEIREGIRHKIYVYTEAVDNSDRNRLFRSWWPVQHGYM